MSSPIQVLIADDSPSVRRLLTAYLDREPDLEVIAAVADGERAIRGVEQHQPDVVTLDVDMPGCDGLTALRRIMASRPTPTVMISGVGSRAADQTFRALQEGAVDFVLKYSSQHPCDAEVLRLEIVSKVRAAARVRTIRSLERGSLERGQRSKPAAGGLPAAAGEASPNPLALSTGVVVIGASTGGPVALRHLLARIPHDFPQPIVIVQHIPGSFTPVLAAQLARHTELEVQPAADGEPLTPGVVLVAPGDVHLLLASDGRVHHHDGPAIHGHRPAIDITMQSAARAFGARTVGVLLTGMGSDGADGLLAIRVAGGRTFAQDEASSVVWGMPQRASERGSVDQLAPPDEIAQALMQTADPAFTQSPFSQPQVLPT
ncbi:MAG: chemotaxis response regulator protein-glutamate methylesterase [Acidobacteriota bacterium]